jgi:exonuclease III
MWVRKSKYLKRKLKYGNKSSKCVAGHWHDSMKEARYCDTLYMLKKGGEIKDYKTQVHYDLKVKKQKICGMRVDFLVTTNSGAKEVHEVKSYPTMTPSWNIKRKLFEALYSPKIEYIVIK